MNAVQRTIRLILRVAFIATCIIMKAISGPVKGLKYRLLAHYLLGSGQDLRLGHLDTVVTGVIHSVDCIDGSTNIVPLEHGWLDEGFGWSIARGDYKETVGGYFIKPPDIEPGDEIIITTAEARDLYDWHDFMPVAEERYWQEMPVAGLAARAAAAILNAAVPSAAFVDGDGQLEVWDGFWPRLGGREFVSRFTIEFHVLPEGNFDWLDEWWEDF